MTRIAFYADIEHVCVGFCTWPWRGGAFDVRRALGQSSAFADATFEVIDNDCAAWSSGNAERGEGSTQRTSGLVFDDLAPFPIMAGREDPTEWPRKFFA